VKSEIVMLNQLLTITHRTARITLHHPPAGMKG